MKSYWIMAAAFLMAWPAGSTAYSMEQSNSNDATVPQAQTTSSSATTPAAGAQNKGSYLLVELSKTLKAKKLKPGDKIKAEVSQDVISHGKVIIPIETKLIGHVTEVTVRDKANPESRLGIVFDKILLKHYQDINFHAVVQAVAPPVQHRSLVDEPSQMLPPSMMLGGVRDSTTSSAGRPGGSGRGVSTSTQSTAMAQSNASVNLQAPMKVEESPSTHTETGSSAARLKPLAPNRQAISVGTPQGITGMKGLSLAPSSASGPVIVSNREDVKLESGTQILLHVLSVETPQASGK